jgi:SulP family sulfate permease
MANAILANVSPVLGLYTLMIATPVAALATSSVFMNVSSTNALSVAAKDTLIGVPAQERTAHLAALVLLIGLVQLLFGVLKLGSMLRFISHSVMTGLRNGVATLIILDQVSYLTGFSSPYNNKVLNLLEHILNWQQSNWPTLVIGIATIALILILSFTRLKEMAMVLALIMITVITVVVNPESVLLVGDISQLPDKLFNFTLPSLTAMASLVPSAIAIAILGLVQGASVSQSHPNPDGNFSNNSRDFVGQGVANIATSFFQGIPAGGSTPGTTVAVRAGARSRLANLFTGLFVAPLVLLFGNYVAHVPVSALAGLLIIIGFQSFRPEGMLTVWQTGLSQRIAMILTFTLTLLIPLQYAVLAGIAMTILHNFFKSSNRVTVVEFEFPDHGFPIERQPAAALESHQLTVLYIYGSLFFASASKLEARLPAVNHTTCAAVVLILRGRDEIGSTFIGVLERYHQALRARNGALFLAGVAPQVQKQLARTGLASQFGENRIFLVQDQLGQSMNSAIIVAQQWLNSCPQKDD